ncbi:MAG: crossover junction endodeoxyribonuclease RuvC [Bacteroidales bacterium]|nr:crossover junction endodeoxyribonuclease RuvC [Bacteroidales bacterium]
MQKERIILGIDPGTNIMGYGVIHQKGNKMLLVTMGILKLGSYSNHALKLKKIFERTLSLVEQYHPDELAIEAPFYGKNVQSMLKLGRAQGVAMAAGLYKELPIFEYSPKKIKQAITGNGNASKEQVAAMLKTLLQFQEIPDHLDATDGLASAVCHYFQGNSSSEKKSYSSWKSFLNDNPGRLKKE